ncbi:DUF2628 domain-containing protein [Paenibacillus sp. IB182496]|uniref:DUF2628 domain-containing protein n=1 Tax=Paenibacillus sabuli TaxID=2772509 RepID=A0A927GTV7_9BACL|nr:DUF2628 domain-containing protein [Paenibacillus sabuli]MBD2847097.1 DUF2628 domain-containing protein [Paenibacillus sabuli]
MKALLKNQAGVTKSVKVGFSWTTFFFGFLVPLFRGDLKWCIILVILEAVFGSFTLGIGAFVTGIIFSFVYNKLYIKELLEKGYAPATVRDQEILEQGQIVARAA